ncbi:MAG: hypothetical protein ACXVB8_08895 [Bdellovibrionota bacterium]
MKRFLLLALLIFPPRASAMVEMRNCHQTCAELLKQDSRCEKSCAEKALQPHAVGFCPEYDPCFQSCERKFAGNHSSTGWGDCRDICVALYIRVDCGHGEPPPGGTGDVDASKGTGGIGGSPVPASAPRESSVTARRAEAPIGSAGSPQAPVDSSLLRSFNGKEKLGNRKAKDPLHPTNDFEKTVEEAISSSVTAGKNGEGSELTLFERVHRKYEERQ